MKNSETRGAMQLLVAVLAQAGVGDEADISGLCLCRLVPSDSDCRLIACGSHRGPCCGHDRWIRRLFASKRSPILEQAGRHQGRHRLLGAGLWEALCSWHLQFRPMAQVKGRHLIRQPDPLFAEVLNCRELQWNWIGIVSKALRIWSQFENLVDQLRNPGRRSRLLAQLVQPGRLAFHLVCLFPEGPGC